MRVALADDSGMIRGALTQMLTGAGLDVCYAARSGAELLAFVDGDQPDAVILDIRMPPGFSEEGLEVAEQIKERHPRVGVLVLSTYGETAYAMRLMAISESGVGYLLKDRVDDVVTLVDALKRVAAGRPAVDPEIVAQLWRRRAARPCLDALGEREQEVLQLMAEGRSNAGIATAMRISPRTVEGYAARIFSKLAVPDDGADNRRVLAVLTWLREGGVVSG